MSENLFAIFGTAFVGIPLIFNSFYFNAYVGNPLKEQRNRKEIKIVSMICTIIQTIGLGLLIWSIVIS